MNGNVKSKVSKYLLPASLPDLLTLRVRRIKRLTKFSGEFLGPVPAWWIIQAARSGRRRSFGAVTVGLLLWQQYRFRRGEQPLKLTGQTLNKFGLKRRFVSHALDTLEKAGLIRMQKFNYRSPLITIVTEEKDYLHGQRG
jgi:hypothetical protein